MFVTGKGSSHLYIYRKHIEMVKVIIAQWFGALTRVKIIRRCCLLALTFPESGLTVWLSAVTLSLCVVPQTTS